jgi:two-component system NarL family response regulator
MRKRKFTAVVADDNPDILMIIRSFAERIPNLAIVAELSNGDDALAAVLKHRPDIAVLDILMPGLSGRQVMEEIQQRGIQTQVLLITAHCRDDYFEPTFWAPALGFVYKLDGLDEHIVPAFRALMDGRPYVSQTPLGFVRSRFIALNAENARLRLLSNDERRAVEFLVQGNSDKEIAASMDLSVKSIERLLRASRQKLGVRSTRELVAYAVKHGIAGG